MWLSMILYSKLMRFFAQQSQRYAIQFPNSRSKLLFKDAAPTTAAPTRPVTTTTNAPPALPSCTFDGDGTCGWEVGAEITNRQIQIISTTDHIAQDEDIKRR